MTLYEYRLREEAQILKQIDNEYDMHLNAWLNRAVSAEKKVGKSGSEYVYKRFKDFFDYNERIQDARRVTRSGEEKLRQIAKRLEKKRKEEENGKL